MVASSLSAPPPMSERMSCSETDSRSSRYELRLAAEARLGDDRASADWNETKKYFYIREIDGGDD